MGKTAYELETRTKESYVAIDETEGKVVSKVYRDETMTVIAWTDGTYSHLYADADDEGGEASLEESWAGFYERNRLRAVGILTKEECDAWQADWRVDFDKSQREHELKQLRELQAKYPQEACQPSNN